MVDECCKYNLGFSKDFDEVAHDVLWIKRLNYLLLFLEKYPAVE